MLKRVASARASPWICSKCLGQARQPRWHSGFAAATPLRPPPASQLYGLPNAQAKDDDATLRSIFDSASFWDSFSRPAQRNTPTGIVGNKYLVHPDGFLSFAHTAVKRCDSIVQKVSSAASIHQYKDIVRHLDQLSDLLCRVIDLADFVRAVHPDGRIQRAADQAYSMMHQYMTKLNTTSVLHDQLKTAQQIPEVYQSWTEQEKVVSNILMEDFSRSVIDLPEGSKQRFIKLNNEIAKLGKDFVERMAPETSHLKFNSRRMKGLAPNLAQQLTNWGVTRIDTMHHEAQMALRWVDDAEVRRDIYMAVRTASKKSVERLEKLLKCRAELAKLSGYESCAHSTLENKMARSPQAVNQFLGALIEDNRHLVQADLQELMALKNAKAEKDCYPGEIKAWDKLYYTHKLLSSVEHNRQRIPDTLSNFFSVGTVMQGLSRLFDQLYGIRLVPRGTQPGEVWDDGVRRLDVVSDTDGHIAVLYCDLFSRPGKTPNPAHFTLRCSREILPSEMEEMQDMDHPFKSPIEAASDGMSVSFNKETNTYFQLPTIALICDFPHPRGSRPPLLNFNDVRTLFHEMGHGLHSFLGRTWLQNVSGTRCATDFAELPSVLMEHFASCPSVLNLYARHWETDAPLPMEMLESRLQIESRMQPSETEAQILLAMLDQSYHSALPLEPSFDSTKVYHEIYKAYASIPEPEGTSWQGFFGHLFGYGATYYSYLFDRAIAGKIWGSVFQRTGKRGSVDRENGERYKREVLRWGGSRDGWKCIAGVLGDEKLAGGGEEAMKEVGRWGVREPGV